MKGILAAVALAAALIVSVPAAAQTSDADWDSGVSHYKQQQYRQAISDFQKVVDSNPEFANTYFYIGLSHFRLKEFGKSIVALTRYLDLAEKGGGKADPSARAALGRAYLITDDNAKAVTVLTVATQQIADDPTNFYYLGVAYQKLNQSDKAIAAYESALKLNPKEVNTLDQMTRLLLAKASVHLAKVVEAKPQDGTAWFNYGLALVRSNQLPKAETALVKATTLAPTNADAFNFLGYVEESLKKYKEALAAYEKANQLQPSPQLQEAIDRVKSVVGTTP